MSYEGKLDFRFADDDDANDIVEFLNVFFEGEVIVPSKSEVDSTNTEQFRPAGPRLSIEDVVEKGHNTNWLVLETPRPEEVIKACARLTLDALTHDASTGMGKRAFIDYIGWSRDDEADYGSSKISSRIQNRFLKRIEAVAYSLGADSVVFSVPQPSEAVQNWLSDNGYEDSRGYLWPEADAARLRLPNPTMLLEFQKVLRDQSAELPKPSAVSEALASQIRNDDVSEICFSIGDEAPTLMVSDLSIDLSNLDSDLELSNLQFISESSGGQTDQIESLVTDLFKALHTNSISTSDDR